MLAPIEAATNIRPTRVAAAVPTIRSKSCQSSMRSASEASMITEAGATAQDGIAQRYGAHRELDDSSNVAVNEREFGSGGADAHVERGCGGGGRAPVCRGPGMRSAAHRGRGRGPRHQLRLRAVLHHHRE